MTSNVLEVQGLTAGYGGGDVLHDVSFTVPEGGITCIVGPNGAGKSTLLAVISGLLRPRAGQVLHRGERLTGKNPRQILRAGVVHVPQNHSLFREMTVTENLELGGYMLGSKRWWRAGGRRWSRCSLTSAPGASGRRAACPAASSGWWSSPAA